MQTVSVPLNKTKLIQHAAGSGVFVLVGLWICSLSPSEMPGPVKHIPWLGYGVSFLGIVLFGAVGFSLVQKLLGSAPGIVFDERGITDDSGVLAAGFIPWENINGFEVAEVSNQK